MRPFYEHVNEKTGKRERIYWDEQRAQEKLAEFVSEAKEFFNAQDVEHARAAGIELSPDAKYLPTSFPDESGAYVPNYLAMQIKHSGAETVDRWKPRWLEFCSRPQSDELMGYPVTAYVPKQPLRNSPQTPAKTAVVAYDIPARKRGRPRKQEMLEV